MAERGEGRESGRRDGLTVGSGRWGPEGGGHRGRPGERVAETVEERAGDRDRDRGAEGQGERAGQERDDKRDSFVTDPVHRVVVGWVGPAVKEGPPEAPGPRANDTVTAASGAPRSNPGPKATSTGRPRSRDLYRRPSVVVSGPSGSAGSVKPTRGSAVSART